jgi:hypothetical protein
MKKQWNSPRVITVLSKNIQAFIKAAAFSGDGCPFLFR